MAVVVIFYGISYKGVIIFIRAVNIYFRTGVPFSTE